MCKSFLWSWRDTSTRKAYEALDHVSVGGQNLISLVEWNRATIDKLLWNLCSKFEKLQIRWVHTYYIKDGDVLSFQPASHCSWILKATSKSMNDLVSSGYWRNFQMRGKY